MRINSFEEVVAWQKGRVLNQELFNNLNSINNYSFKDQMFRASLSITNNIAEGFERGTNKELRYFLYIARGSAAEVRSMLYTALDNKYIDSEKFTELTCLVSETGRLLTGFIKKLSIDNYPTIKLSNNKTKPV